MTNNEMLVGVSFARTPVAEISTKATQFRSWDGGKTSAAIHGWSPTARSSQKGKTLKLRFALSWATTG